MTYQNLLFCRVLINSILGFIIRTYKKVGFGSFKVGFRVLAEGIKGLIGLTGFVRFVGIEGF